MKMEPVNLDGVNDIRYFLELIKIVDNDSFLRDIYEARAKLEIEVTPIKVEPAHIHIVKKIPIDQPPKIMNKWRSNIKNKKLIGKISPGSLELTAISLAKKYTKTKGYGDVIQNIILHHQISTKPIYRKPQTHGGLVSGSSAFVIPGFYKQRQLTLDRTEGAIIINPWSTRKEVYELFREFHKTLLILKKDKILDRLISQNKEYKKLEAGVKEWDVPDTISNIRRDRNWYWHKQKGLSYSQIHHLAISEGEHISEDGVIKAIKQYKKLVNE